MRLYQPIPLVLALAQTTVGTASAPKNQKISILLHIYDIFYI
jgi:hypothetical protein